MLNDFYSYSFIFRQLLLMLIDLFSSDFFIQVERKFINLVSTLFSYALLHTFHEAYFEKSCNLYI